MRLNNVFIWVCIALFPILLSSCGIKSVELKSINDIDYQHTKKNGNTVIANITLFNPNGVKFTIQDIDIDVYIGETYLGKMEAPDTLIVDKKSEFTTDFSIHLKKKNLLLAGASFLGYLGKGKMEINLKGNMHVKYLYFNKDIHIEHSELVKLK